MEKLVILQNRLKIEPLPFAGITKKDVLNYLKSQKGIKINRDNTEECKKTVTDHVESVTIYCKDHSNIVLKYNIAVMPKAGGGGATPTQALLIIAR